jgi:hypothetical protein
MSHPSECFHAPPLQSFNKASKSLSPTLRKVPRRLFGSKARVKGEGSFPSTIDRLSALSAVPVSMVVTISQVEGPIVGWCPPPPSNRCWMSFLSPPKVGRLWESGTLQQKQLVIWYLDCLYPSDE